MTRLRAVAVVLLAWWPLAIGAAFVATQASGAAAQTVRRLATIDELRQFPGYFHLQNVVLHGEFVENGSRVSLRADEREMNVLLKDVKTTSGLVEVRAQLLDVGRLEPGDPRLTGYEGARDPERWPRPGEDLVLAVTGISEAQLATTPSVRSLALQPWRFEGQKVTVVGQFRGRNLFGDLPSAPGKSPYDFVLRSVDGAVWVSGLRPRGRGFDLSVDARVDTGRWLQISGTVSRNRGLVIIDATEIMATTAPELPPPVEDVAPAPPPQRGEVVFNSPTDNEIDVPANSPVRLQFSRGLDPKTIADRIRVSYLGGDAMPLEFTHTYDAGTRAIEIKFARPLEPFRTVRVELLEGIKTFDGAPVTPWTLTFSVGG